MGSSQSAYGRRYPGASCSGIRRIRPVYRWCPGLAGQFVFVDIDRVVLDASQIDRIDPSVVNELGDVSGASAADYKAEAEKDSDEMEDWMFHIVSEFLMVSVSRCPLSMDLRRMS